MMKIILLATLAFAVTKTALATPTTVDFEEYSTTTVTAVVSTKGFLLTPSFGNVGVVHNAENCGGGTCASNGSSVLHAVSSQLLTLKAANGGSFYFRGFDYAEYQYIVPTLNATSIRVTGHIFQGGTVTQDFLLDGVIDGTGGADDFQFGSIGVSWNSLIFQDLVFEGLLTGFRGGQFAIDNVLVDTIAASTAVPEPSSLALSVLAIVALVRSQKRNRSDQLIQRA